MKIIPVEDLNMNKKIFLLWLFALTLNIVGCSAKSQDSDSSRPQENISNSAEIVVEIPNQNKYVPGDLVMINPVAATADSPAKPGDWIETKRYSSQDSSYHTIYFCVTDIIRDDKRTEPVLLAYNQKRHIKKFKKLKDENLQYCIIKYRVFFPEVFPESEHGICDADLVFDVVKPNRMSDPKDLEDPTQFTVENDEYLFLSSVFDITSKPSRDKLHPGDIYTYGTAVFILDRNEHDYQITHTYYIGQNPTTNYISGL